MLKGKIVAGYLSQNNSSCTFHSLLELSLKQFVRNTEWMCCLGHEFMLELEIGFEKFQFIISQCSEILQK
jgi:hypothetical protein